MQCKIKVVEEDVTSHICSAPIHFNLYFSAFLLYQFVFLHVKSKGGCHRRQLACLTHMIEAAAICNVPERQTSLISGRLLHQCPFAQSMRMKVAGWLTLSKAEVPLQIYTIHPSAGHGVFPWCKAATDLLLLKAVRPSLTPGKLTGGLLSQRANLLSRFHSITEAIIWDFYLSRKKLLM